MELLPSIAHTNQRARDAAAQDAREDADRWPAGSAMVLLAAVSLGLWALIVAAVVWVV